MSLDRCNRHGRFDTDRYPEGCPRCAELEEFVDRAWEDMKQEAQKRQDRILRHKKEGRK